MYILVTLSAIKIRYYEIWTSVKSYLGARDFSCAVPVSVEF